MQSSTVAAWILIIIAAVVIFIAGKCSFGCSNFQRDNFNNLIPQARSYTNNYSYGAQPDIIYVDAAEQIASTPQQMPANHPAHPNQTAAVAACHANLARGIPLEYAY